jgi:hypothetical protein
MLHCQNPKFQTASVLHDRDWKTPLLSFNNHCQHIILYSYIQYCRFTALTPVSNTVLHRFAPPQHNALCSPAFKMYHSVVHTRYLLYATHRLACERKNGCPILAVRRSYIAIIAFREHSTLFRAALDNPTIFCYFLIREGSGSHDVTGLACRHTTRRCSQLQYECSYNGMCAAGLNCVYVNSVEPR